MAEPAAGGGALDAIKAMLGDISMEQLVVLLLLSQAIQPALAPYQREIMSLAQTSFPNTPLSPADLASAVVRGFLKVGDAKGRASENGIDAGNFMTMVRLAAEALGPDAAAVALRRGIIPEDSGDPDKPGFVQAIQQGNLRDMWAPVVKALAVNEPTPGDILDALLQGQTDKATAVDLFVKLGGDPAYFDLLFNTRGSAPTPVEAATMANRGVIPWDGEGPGVVSFHQAFLEGPWRDKWEAAFKALAAYFPPPRTVTAMVHEGSMTDADATKYLMEQGLSADLAAAYVESAHHQKLQATKDLARGTVEALYRDRIIDRATAQTFIERLGFTAADADFILSVVDVQRVQASLSSAVSRIRTLYVSYKLPRSGALSTLAAMQIPQDQVAALMEIWDLERAANVKVLTPGEIASAFHYGVLDQATAQAELERLGYAPHDAWVVLSVREHGPLDNEPPKDAMPLGAGPG